MSSHPLRTIVRSGSESLPLSNKSCSRKMDAAAWPERQSNGSRCWRCRNGSHANPSKVLIGLQQIIPCPPENLKQIIHRRNFLELLGQEPLEEIDRDVVVLLSGEFDEPVDLLGHMNFLIERKFHSVTRGLEFRFRRIDRRDHHASAGIDNVFDKAQRMRFLFLGLLEKML